MRITLTLDDDVAVALARRSADRGTGLRREVNEVLRAALGPADPPSAGSDEPYVLPTFDPGQMLIADHRALKELLEEEEEDVERALQPRGP